MRDAVTWTGLILLVAGSCLWLLPLIPAVPAGGGAMTDVPHLPWTGAAITALGLVLLLWQRARAGGN